ncbi:DUF5677 domain-containing protein [Micromonospora saelicesensis]|uniref:DUF5677 domain-containing protein n=1 Tax=Micromonospora saelicesensis TaxID=285676 RepID=UPI0011BFDB70|nr:DUF5677 domain-containing protein [Micromonospora saelicesensis]
MDRLLEEAVSLADELVPTQMKAVREKSASRVAGRRRTGHRVQRKIHRDWKEVIDAYDHLLATSEEIHSRAIANMVRKWKRDNSPGPPKASTKSGVDDALTGSDLKMFVLLSLVGRACKTGSEVGHLAFGGFSDGATARLRTLYEIVMIQCALAIAPYEVCERYQAYATIEYLADLKEQRRYKVARSLALDEVDTEIAEIEAAASKLFLRWGRDIRRPFEWARPILDSPTGRITFSDLDRQISGHGWRTMYLTANHLIHAGSFATVNGFDASKRYLNSTRAALNDDGLLFVIQGSAALIELATEVFCRQFALETGDPDECLSSKAVKEAARAVVSATDSDPRQA